MKKNFLFLLAFFSSSLLCAQQTEQMGKEDVLEIHIPNWEKNLYEKELEIEIIEKIRDEQKFKSLEELKTQIKKDVQKCLELS